MSEAGAKRIRTLIGPSLVGFTWTVSGRREIRPRVRLVSRPNGRPKRGFSGSGPGRGCGPGLALTLSETVVIPRRFNGPSDNGQGGYCAGIAAGLVGGAADVSLRRPIPLDTPLTVTREDGGAVRLIERDTTIIEAKPVDRIDVEVPSPVDLH